VRAMLAAAVHAPGCPFRLRSACGSCWSQPPGPSSTWPDRSTAADLPHLRRYCVGIRQHL